MEDGGYVYKPRMQTRSTQRTVPELSTALVQMGRPEESFQDCGKLCCLEWLVYCLTRLALVYRPALLHLQELERFLHMQSFLYRGEQLSRLLWTQASRNCLPWIEVSNAGLNRLV